VVVIALDTTATTLVSSPNPANTGEAITLTATVFSPAGAPIGTVVFKEGSVVLGTAALDTDGHASITRTLAPGTHTIVATYAGGGAFGASVSNPLTQIVNGAPGGAATIPTLGRTALMLLAIGLAVVRAPRPALRRKFDPGSNAAGRRTWPARSPATLSENCLMIPSSAYRPC
jgi:hypothetical protein